MNFALYDRLLKECWPGQNIKEYRFFLEFLEAYFKNRGIANPIIVELGVRGGCQKRYYEQILGAKYIGIDIEDTYSVPDILGNTHDPQTLATLKDLLGGQPINALFIDADHAYESVKKDFEIYEPLVKNIIAFHDIKTVGFGVIELWPEIIEREEPWVKSMFYQKNLVCPHQYGIGVIIKEL